AIALTRVDVGWGVSRDLIYFVILPPLLFEAALNLRWRDLRADAGLLLTLSTLGTVIAAACVAIGVLFFIHWPLPAALAFGALIAATVPVAVIAMFKDNGVQGRLRTLMESESLFNDAAAAVLFGLALSFATAEAQPNMGQLAWQLGRSIAGGLVIGGSTGA